MTGRTRWTFLVLEAFVAVGAAYGGARLLIDAEAFGMRESWLDGSPFADYTVPGLALLAGIGGGMAIAWALALRRDRRAPAAAVLMGAALAVFLAVETAVIGYRAAVQLFLIVAMGVPAVVLMALGARAGRTG